MQQTDKVWWCIAALSGAVMVILGAYAAHGLAARTTEAMVSAVETGVRYQAWHTLALMVVLVWRQVQPLTGQRWVLALWSLGWCVFRLALLDGIGGDGARYRDAHWRCIADGWMAGASGGSGESAMTLSIVPASWDQRSRVYK